MYFARDIGVFIPIHKNGWPISTTSRQHQPTFELNRAAAQEAKRELNISYETIRRWVPKSGPAVARRLRRQRPKASPRWHLDGTVVRIGSAQVHLRRAVNDEGEVLDVVVQRRSDKVAIRKLKRKPLTKQGFAPAVVTNDKLRS